MATYLLISVSFVAAAAAASPYRVVVRTPQAGARIVLARAGRLGADVGYYTPLVPLLTERGSSLKVCTRVEDISRPMCREGSRSSKEEVVDFAFDMSSAAVGMNYTLQTWMEVDDTIVARDSSHFFLVASPTQSAFGASIDFADLYAGEVVRNENLTARFVLHGLEPFSGHFQICVRIAVAPIFANIQNERGHEFFRSQFPDSYARFTAFGENCFAVDSLEGLLGIGIESGPTIFVAYARHVKIVNEEVVAVGTLTPSADVSVMVTPTEPELSSLFLRVWPFMTEGSTDNYPAVRQSLYRLAESVARRSSKQATFCESGFNAGFSAATFLMANESAIVVSYDLGEHAVVPVAQRAIQDAFGPGRHFLVLGDSTETIPKKLVAPPHLTEDAVNRCSGVFVDGGHTYEVAMADLRNFCAKTLPDNFVVLDDVGCSEEWCSGPKKAWLDAVDAGFVKEIECTFGPHFFAHCIGQFDPLKCTA